MKHLHTLFFLVLSCFVSSAATTVFPASTNGNNIFTGNNQFTSPTTIGSSLIFGGSHGTSFIGDAPGGIGQIDVLGNLAIKTNLSVDGVVHLDGGSDFIPTNGATRVALITGDWHPQGAFGYNPGVRIGDSDGGGPGFVSIGATNAIDFLLGDAGVPFCSFYKTNGEYCFKAANNDQYQSADPITGIRIEGTNRWIFGGNSDNTIRGSSVTVTNSVLVGTSSNRTAFVDYYAVLRLSNFGWGNRVTNTTGQRMVMQVNINHTHQVDSTPSTADATLTTLLKSSPQTLSFTNIARFTSSSTAGFLTASDLFIVEQTMTAFLAPGDIVWLEDADTSGSDSVLSEHTVAFGL